MPTTLCRRQHLVSQIVQIARKRKTLRGGIRRVRGADGNRNRDLFDANETLYQLSYSPLACCSAPQSNSQQYSTKCGQTQFGTECMWRRRCGMGAEPAAQHGTALTTRGTTHRVRATMHRASGGVRHEARSQKQGMTRHAAAAIRQAPHTSHLTPQARRAPCARHRTRTQFRRRHTTQPHKWRRCGSRRRMPCRLSTHR